MDFSVQHWYDKEKDVWQIKALKRHPAASREIQSCQGVIQSCQGVIQSCQVEILKCQEKSRDTGK